MILHARWQGAHCDNRPTLVWLHGFLGSGQEWQPIQDLFSGWPQLSVDLPGHGGSRAQRVEGFAELSARLGATLQSHRVKRYWLIGYSLGGRVALYHACRSADASLTGVITEGAHFGLATAAERAQRLASDRHWAARFRQQPLVETLEQWYRQPVFADLNQAQRAALIALRADNDPQALAAMLLSTSLARQPYLLPESQRLARLHSLCGEYDLKFQRLAARSGAPLTLIPAAGHNAHRASPQAFAAALMQKITA
ncbi:2-succinyl-6-hydroxy-2,4-cyclohexadiene-1-carboxylate synthase [Erwinia sp. CGal63]|uniref:2-succinyl-6-hydroxy-2, 4-cyclohexadiene-1-carboxylate synthase n=1 Tax=Erwinia sp. CGal63 TaxID=2919889 RepID=UPI00300ABA7F